MHRTKKNKYYAIKNGGFAMNEEIYKLFDDERLLNKYKELEIQFQGNICDIYNYLLYNYDSCVNVSDKNDFFEIKNTVAIYICHITMLENGYCNNKDNICNFDTDDEVNQTYEKYYKTDTNEQYLKMCVSDSGKMMFKELLDYYDNDILGIYSHICSILYADTTPYEHINIECMIAHKYMLDNGYKIASNITPNKLCCYTKESAKKDE